MTPRLNKLEKDAQGAIQAMLGLEKYLAASGLEKRLRDMVCLRVSQINGWNRMNIAFRNTPGTYQPQSVRSSAVSAGT